MSKPFTEVAATWRSSAMQTSSSLTRTSSRWVTTHEQDEVLVVLDGRVHNLPEQDRAQVRQLVERYRQAGDQLAAGLLGDFVIVVLDRAARTLLVARDPVGVRPWYVTESSRGCAGATDLAVRSSTCRGWIPALTSPPRSRTWARCSEAAAPRSIAVSAPFVPGTRGSAAMAAPGPSLTTSGASLPRWTCHGTTRRSGVARHWT